MYIVHNIIIICKSQQYKIFLELNFFELISNYGKNYNQQF